MKKGSESGDLKEPALDEDLVLDEAWSRASARGLRWVLRASIAFVTRISVSLVIFYFLLCEMCRLLERTWDC